MAEHDGIDEALGNSMRTSLMAAGRIAEQLARVAENKMRHKEAHSAQESRELQSRFDTERLAARAQLAVVDHKEWWDTADAAGITEAWQTANAWRSLDPEIERSATRIQSEIGDRWGIDPQDTGARPDQVREYLQRILEASRIAGDELTQAKKLEAEAAELILEADAMKYTRESGHVEDIAADEEKEGRLRDQIGDLNSLATDHRKTADAMLGLADGELQEAKVTADKGQALPAEHATAGAGKRSRRAPRRGTEQAQEHAVSR